jgi:hypothetical protein
MKRKFATSKLSIDTDVLDNLEKFIEAECHLAAKSSSSKSSRRSANQQTMSSCRLTMTNSKYLDYERCIDELITKIECDQQDISDEKTDNTVDKDTFLGWFNLADTKSVEAEKKLHCENLLLRLRKMMLDINYQFIVDIDKWKAHHASCTVTTTTGQDTNYKIHMKPHVNLTRPLLIRSKKIKRSGGPLVSTNGSTSITANSGASLKKASSSSNLKAAVGNNKPSAAASVTTTTTTTTTFSKPFFAGTNGTFSASAAIKHKQIIQQQQQQQRQQTEAAKAAAEQAPNVNNEKKRRKQAFDKPLRSIDDEVENINAAKFRTANNLTIPIQSVSSTDTISMPGRKKAKRAKEGETVQPVPPLQIQPHRPVVMSEKNGNIKKEDDDDDDEVEEIDEDETITKPVNTQRSRSSNNRITYPPQPPKLTKMTNKSNNERNQMGSNGKANRSGDKNGVDAIPAPPPLYKAPTHFQVQNIHSRSKLPTPPLLVSQAPGMLASMPNMTSALNFSSNANSSRLANASGMNMTLAHHNHNLSNLNKPQSSLPGHHGMPKLQPQVTLVTSVSNNLSKSLNNSFPNLNGQQTMAKLKPILPKPRQLQQQHEQLQTQQQRQITSPKKLSNGRVSQHRKMAPNSQLLNQITTVVSNSSEGGSHGSSSSSSSNSSSGEGANTTADSLLGSSKLNSENVHLKCKFCMQVFKQQMDFFQHVITNHAETLKHKLNKATAAAFGLANGSESMTVSASHSRLGSEHQAVNNSAGASRNSL